MNKKPSCQEKKRKKNCHLTFTFFFVIVLPTSFLNHVVNFRCSWQNISCVLRKKTLLLKLNICFCTSRVCATVYWMPQCLLQEFLALSFLILLPLWHWTKKKKRWLMCCAAATCLTAQYTWLQPYEFSRLGSSSYCDPYSLGQNTVCSQWCHWEMSRVLVGDSLSTLMQVDSYGLLVTISFRFSPASSPPGYPVRHNN